MRARWRARTEVLMALFLAGFLVLVGRMVQLQIVRGARYEKLARVAAVERRVLPPRRGRIEDRFGGILADNVPVHDLYAVPRRVRNPAALARRLGALLGWSVEEIERTRAMLVEAKRGRRPDKPVLVARGLVADRCPDDQSPLEEVAPVTGWHCPECGRTYVRVTGSKDRCPHGERLRATHTAHLWRCRGTRQEATDGVVCPHDGVALQPLSLRLRCPRCGRYWDAQEAVVRSHLHELRGVFVRTRLQRVYPRHELAAHVLGYMNEVNARDLARWPGRYHPGDWIGRTGVERVLEESLRGEPGMTIVLRGPDGQTIEDPSRLPPALRRQVRPATDGRDVRLTIDPHLQEAVARAMHPFRSGAAVVLDPWTGEVLAMHSEPPFDPNHWSGRMDRAIKAQYDDNPYAPMMNKATTAYPPASAFKIVTALAALDAGVITPSTRFDCPGYYEFGGRKFRCYARGGHGKALNLHRAFVVSCDVYFYRVAELLGIDRLHDFAVSAFHLGRRTGIELPESPGRVPDRNWYAEHSRIGWQPGFTLSTAIGQGALTTTPLQMAVAVAAVANGGTLYRPRVVAGYGDPRTGNFEPTKPQVLGHLPASPRALRTVRQALADVVADEDEGTGKRAHSDLVAIAGKTGTAEARQHKRGADEEIARWLLQDHAWFVAFAPADDPRVVVVVFVEHGGSGGRVAAPVARRIVEAWYRERH